MVIVKLFGGLGNQLFQYAAAKGLSAYHQTELKVDVSSFQSSDLRSFELHRLNPAVAVASAEEIASLTADTPSKRIAARFTPYRWKKFYKEPHFHYDRSFFKLSGRVYIQGYFQSEKYFYNQRKPILEELKFSNVVSKKIETLGAKLKDEPSVAVHFRRGDYLKKDTLDYHGVLPTSYYQQAFNVIRQKIPNARFYLFSDDPAKATNELRFMNGDIISDTASMSNLDDLFLMSCCQNIIIANSSFSWWAAWLNTHSTKAVMAPKAWFKGGPKDTGDLIPQSWISI